MRTPTTLLVLASLALPLVAGCETQPRQAISPGFGNAVEHDIAVQIVNPEPGPVTGAPSLDGRRAVDAFERYREGDVIHPPAYGISRLGVGPGQGTMAHPAPAATPQ